MEQQQSVSQWIEGLKRGEQEAVQQLWNRYARRLEELARQKLKHVPKRVADEEDVAQSVFHCICRGAEAGRFASVRNRDDLWWMLLSITRQKVADFVRRETAKKRGAGRVQTEAALRGAADSAAAFELDNLIGEEPDPQFLAILVEENERLLGLLRDDRLRNIAIARIEGYTVTEIAEELKVSNRSVERKLSLIRKTWAKELADAT